MSPAPRPSQVDVRFDATMARLDAGRRRVRIIQLLLLTLLCVPCVANAGWLQLNKSQTGFVFEGIAEGEPFSFDVPGDTYETYGEDGRAFVRIDDVLVQVMRLPISGNPGDDILGSHRASEVSYLQGVGAVVSDSAVCATLAIPHREWRATLSNGSTSTYLTLRTGDHVLVIVLAADAATTTRPVEAKLSALCGSLTAA